MTRPGAARAIVVACVTLLTHFYSAPAQGQAASGNYEVRKGEGLLAISSRLPQYKGVTRFQIVAAIYRANPDVFPDGNINVLKEGQLLKLPSQEQVAGIPAAEASGLWRQLVAKPAPPAPIASAKPTPVPEVAPRAPKGVPLGRADQIRRYREGLALERRGDDKAALDAFLEAGESGYGPAQRKLGQIYDKGNSAVERDYGAALKWYQRAREQGMDIPKPFVRSPR